MFPSTAEILDFILLSSLYVLDDVLQHYDFAAIIMGDFSTTKKLAKNVSNIDVSNIPKNLENETVYRILIKDSYVPMLSVSEKCSQHQFYYKQNPLEN